jgi:hypothetical protein
MSLWTRVKNFCSKYGALIVGALVGALAFIALGRKDRPVVPPTDADNNGVQDQQQIEQMQEQAAEHRAAAEQHVEAAQEAVNKPVAVTPSKDVREAVQRNNEVDY